MSRHHKKFLHLRLLDGGLATPIQNTGPKSEFEDALRHRFFELMAKNESPKLRLIPGRVEESRI